jgi:hypothetical protein
MVSSAQASTSKLDEKKTPSNSLLAPVPAAPAASSLLSPQHTANGASTTRNHHRAHSNSNPHRSGSDPVGSSFDREYHAGQDLQEKEREKLREKEVEETKGRNRVLGVLMSRLGSSKTFGENVIFMLNRCRTY